MRTKHNKYWNRIFFTFSNADEGFVVANFDYAVKMEFKKKEIKDLYKKIYESLKKRIDDCVITYICYGLLIDFKHLFPTYYKIKHRKRVSPTEILLLIFRSVLLWLSLFRLTHSYKFSDGAGVNRHSCVKVCPWLSSTLIANINFELLHQFIQFHEVRFSSEPAVTWNEFWFAVSASRVHRDVKLDL